jgi:hypothetical protein
VRITPSRIFLAVVLLLFGFGAAAWYAPEVRADSLRAPLQNALRRTLGRDVVIGDLRYRLVPTPGVTAYDMVIPDDPAFGLEPLAYVTELDASIRWWALAIGRFELSSVRMNEASVNLVRKEGQGWNFARLLERMVAGAKGAGAPELELRACRINFRNETRKSAFFLNSVDVDLTPPKTAGGDVKWTYEASPARSDRAEQGFGRFTGKGRWYSSKEPEGRLDVESELEPSAASEVLTLLAGRDLGVQGRVSSRARFYGPVRDVRIQGRIDLEKIDRPVLLGLRGSDWSLPYEGKLDLVGQSAEFHTVALPGKPDPHLSLQMEGRQLLSNLDWSASVHVKEMPVPAMVDLATRFGARTPQRVSLNGVADGQVAFRKDKPASGALTVKDARVDAERVSLKAEAVAVALDGGRARMEPVSVELASGAKAEMRGEWSFEDDSFGVEMKAAGVLLEEWKALTERSVPRLPIPLRQCSGGRGSGTMRLNRPAEAVETEAEWSGELELSETRCAVEGSASPLVLSRALVSFGDGRWTARRFTGVWGETTVSGDATCGLAGKRPCKFRMVIPEAVLEELIPTIDTAAGRQGLLDRTLANLPFRRGAPAWLRGRHVEGSIAIGKLSAGEWEFSGLRARVYWDGASLRASALHASCGTAKVNGELEMDLAGAPVDMRYVGRVEDVRWDDRTVDVDGELFAALFGDRGLRTNGQFQIRGLEAEGEKLETVSGVFDYDVRRRDGRLRLRSVEAPLGTETLLGRGESAADGSLTLELSGTERALRWTGTMTPFELKPAEARETQAREK